MKPLASVKRFESAPKFRSALPNRREKFSKIPLETFFFCCCSLARKLEDEGGDASQNEIT